MITPQHTHTHHMSLHIPKCLAEYVHIYIKICMHTEYVYLDTHTQMYMGFSGISLLYDSTNLEDMAPQRLLPISGVARQLGNCHQDEASVGGLPKAGMFLRNLGFIWIHNWLKVT